MPPDVDAPRFMPFPLSAGRGIFVDLSRYFG